MKIGHLENTPAVTPVAAERKPGAGEATVAAAATPPSASEPSAKVELSEAASLLSVEGGAAEFDAEKVARITEAIREGRFQINAEAIADKLIANAAELLGRTQR
jgi:negative regulator of flagellin synthesis FlgM